MDWGNQLFPIQLILCQLVSIIWYTCLVCLIACLVDGAWSEWTTTGCSVSCGVGRMYRNRSCSDPEPQYGGITCQGVASEYFKCELPRCPGNYLRLVQSEWAWHIPSALFFTHINQTTFHSVYSFTFIKGYILMCLSSKISFEEFMNSEIDWNNWRKNLCREVTESVLPHKLLGYQADMLCWGL